MAPRLLSLTVADPPELWAELGFTVDAGSAQIGAVRHDLGVVGKGVRSWTLSEAVIEGEELEGVATTVAERGDDPSPGVHPNGTLSLDHVVLATPDLQRTIGALGDAGFELRRVRRTGSPDRPIEQAFFRLGEAILEVVGPPDATGDGPCRFYGLAFTVADLDATAVFLGDRLRPAKEAVQPGRRIATLDRSAGSTVPIAFMSPEG